MRTLLWHFILCWLGTLDLAAQFEVLPPDQPLAVFPGEGRTLRVAFRNTGNQMTERHLSTRLWQLSSSLTMPAGDIRPWKKLTVLSGQTIMESIDLTFPAVRSVTHFQVQWFDDHNNTIGQTLVSVFPTNLLQELAELAGKRSFGVFDSQQRLAPLLGALKVEFADLAQREKLSSFVGAFVIIGPLDTVPAASVRKSMVALAGNEVGVVLIAPRRKEKEMAPLELSGVFTSGRIVMVAPETFADIDSDPLAQLRLIQCVRLALDPFWLLTDVEF